MTDHAPDPSGSDVTAESEELFTAIVEQMKRPPKHATRGHAQRVVQHLELHDLARLRERLQIRGELRRGFVAACALPSAAFTPERELVPKPERDPDLDLLIEVGRISQRFREAAVRAVWDELGLSSLHRRLLGFMPGHHAHNELSWLDDLFVAMKEAPSYEVSAEPEYHDGRAVTLLVLEAGAPDGDEPVQILIVVEGRSTDASIPVVSPDRILDVTVQLLPRCFWRLSQAAGSALLAKAHAVAESAHRLSG